MDELFMRATNNVCTECGGKGFHWKEGKILSRRDGSEVATLYSEGPKCEACHGTGEAGPLLWSRYFAYVAMALAILFMFVIPGLRLLF